MRIRTTLIGTALAGVLALALAPAAQAAVGRCGPLSYDADGSIANVMCPNGSANALARTPLRKAAPRTMALGADPGWAAVRAALCADVARMSIPITTDAYEWQFARYGWEGAYPSPTTVGNRLAMSLCPGLGS